MWRAVVPSGLRKHLHWKKGILDRVLCRKHFVEKNVDNLRVQVVEELGAAGGRSRADDHGRGVGSADTVPGETQKWDSLFGKTEMPILMVGFDDARLRSLCLDPVTENQARVDR